MVNDSLVSPEGHGSHVKPLIETIVNPLEGILCPPFRWPYYSKVLTVAHMINTHRVGQSPRPKRRPVRKAEVDVGCAWVDVYCPLTIKSTRL